MKSVFLVSFLISILVGIQAWLLSPLSVTSSKYVLTVPKILSSPTEKLCLVFMGDDLPTTLNIRLYNEQESDRNVYSRTYDIQNASSCYEFSTKSVYSDKVLLNVATDRFNETHTLSYMPNNGFTLIETSEETYSPSSLLSFRIFSFNQKLVPINVVFNRIWVEDATGKPIMEWSKVKSNGFIFREMLISSLAKTGRWKIRVLLEKQIIEKEFNVVSSASQKTFLYITPDYFLLNESWNIKICVRNNLGIEIGGYLRINFIPLNESHYDQYKITTKIDKCALITLDNIFPNNKNDIKSIRLDIYFTKNNSINSLFMTKTIKIVNHSVMIQLPSQKITKLYFKHYLPYFGSLIVTDPMDLHLSEVVKICFEARKIPYINGEKKYCHLFTPNELGMVNFEIPPMDKEIQQIYIEASPKTDSDNIFTYVLHPSLASIRNSLLIEPIYSVLPCNDFTVNFLFTGTNESILIHYQISELGSLNQPHMLLLETKPYYFNDIFNYQKFSREIRIASFAVSMESYASLQRVIIFSLSNEEIIADSQSFLVDCLVSRSSYSNYGNEDSEENEICSTEVSTSPQRFASTQEKINSLLVSFDDSYNTHTIDKCDMQSVEKYRAPVIDYKSDWDAFQSVGLEVFTNYQLDNTPCESDVYPRGVPSEVIENIQNISKTYPKFEKTFRNRNLARNEQVFDNLLVWNYTNSKYESDELNNKISSYTTRYQKLYKQNVCVKSEKRFYLRQEEINNNLLFEVQVDGPKCMFTNETVPLTVVVKKNVDGCFSLKMDILKYSQTKSLCVCREKTLFVFHVSISEEGKQNVTVVMSSGDVEDCDRREIQPVTREFQIYVKRPSFEKKSTKLDIVCMDSDKKEVQLKADEVTIATDIINVLLDLLEDQPVYGKNSLRINALLSPLVTLYRNYEKTLLSELKKRITNEISKSYQELYHYKLNDGSYSLFSGRKVYPDLPLTVSIFKTLAEARKNHKFINEYELKKTLLYIYSRQSTRDGCFYIPRSRSTQWPLRLESPLQSTAYITATLLEAGHAQPILKEAFKCLQNQNQTDMPDVTRALLAYIYSKVDEFDKTQEYLSVLEDKAVRSEEQIYWENDYNKETAALYSLIKQAMDNYDDVRKVNNWLYHQEGVLYESLTAYAMTKAWIMLRSDQHVTVETDTNKVHLSPFKTYILDKYQARKFTLKGSGCILLEAKHYEKNYEHKTKQFKLTVTGLQKGYKSCDDRNMKICIKQIMPTDKLTYVFPALNVHLPTGYTLNEPLLNRMMQDERSNLIDSYQNIEKSLLISLVPFKKSSFSCFELPIQKEYTVESKQKFYVEITNSYGKLGDSDYYTYQMPKTCELVDQKELHQHVYSPTSYGQSMKLPERSEYIFPCPEDTIDECPVCENILSEESKKKMCSSDITALVSKRYYYTKEQYKKIYNFTEKENSRLCKVVPLKLRELNYVSPIGRQVITKSDVLNLYMPISCKCKIHERSIAILNNCNTENNIKQLTKQDRIITYNSSENILKECNKRKKREISLHECQEPKVCPDCEEFDEALLMKACNYPIIAILESKTYGNCKQMSVVKFVKGNMINLNLKFAFKLPEKCICKSLLSDRVVIIGSYDIINNGQFEVNDKMLIASLKPNQTFTCPLNDSNHDKRNRANERSYEPPPPVYAPPPPPPPTYAPPPPPYAPPPPTQYVEQGYLPPPPPPPPEPKGYVPPPPVYDVVYELPKYPQVQEQTYEPPPPPKKGYSYTPPPYEPPPPEPKGYAPPPPVYEPPPPPVYPPQVYEPPPPMYAPPPPAQVYEPPPPPMYAPPAQVYEPPPMPVYEPPPPPVYAPPPPPVYAPPPPPVYEPSPPPPPPPVYAPPPPPVYAPPPPPVYEPPPPVYAPPPPPVYEPLPPPPVYAPPPPPVYEPLPPPPVYAPPPPPVYEPPPPPPVYAPPPPPVYAPPPPPVYEPPPPLYAPPPPPVYEPPPPVYQEPKGYAPAPVYEPPPLQEPKGYKSPQVYTPPQYPEPAGNTRIRTPGENLPGTQYEYRYPGEQSYSRPPGYLRMGYFWNVTNAKKRNLINPVYNYYSGQYVPYKRSNFTNSVRNVYKWRRSNDKLYLVHSGYVPVQHLNVRSIFRSGLSTGVYSRSASEHKPLESQESCPPVAKSCPICENYINLNMLEDICNTSIPINIFSAMIDSSSLVMDGKASCGRAKRLTIYTNSTEIPNELLYSLDPSCACDQLIETGGQVFILTSKFVSSSLAINDNVNVISYSTINENDIKNLLSCRL